MVVVGFVDMSYGHNAIDLILKDNWEALLAILESWEDMTEARQSMYVYRLQIP